MPKISEINGKPEWYMDKLKQFMKNPLGFYYIAGSNGCGKSFTARALYDCFVVDDSDDKLFYNMVNLNLDWQRQIKEWGDSLYLLNNIMKTKLLILDDLGTRRPSDAFMDFLYAIAELRFESRSTCGTIITTNLNGEEIRHMFGDAFLSRVLSGIVVRYDGTDRRLQDFK